MERVQEVEARKWGLWGEVVCLEDCIGCAGWDVGFLGERLEFRVGLHLGGEVGPASTLLFKSYFSTLDVLYNGRVDQRGR